MFKIAAIFVYTFLIRIAAILPVELNGVDYHVVFPFFIAMILLPEMIFILVPKFRKWIKDGVEDGDGVLNKGDLSGLMVHYSTLWCIRLFVVFGLLEAFYGIQVREIFVVGALSGAFGIESMNLLAKFFSKAK